jgi:hypothetical protein
MAERVDSSTSTRGGDVSSTSRPPAKAAETEGPRSSRLEAAPYRLPLPRAVKSAFTRDFHAVRVKTTQSWGVMAPEKPDFGPKPALALAML